MVGLRINRCAFAIILVIFALPVFAQTGGEGHATNAFAERMRESIGDSVFGPGERAAGAPGYGYPGQIEPYKASTALEANLQRYGLTAGWYVRDAVAANFSERGALDYHAKKNKNRAFPDRVPFVLYTPRPGGGAAKAATASLPSDRKDNGGGDTTALPMLVFLPGRGELGTDLNKLFGQKGIIEKVTSAAFQEKRPCYLLIPSPPGSFATLMGGLPHRPSLAQNLMNDAILAVARAQQSPPVDLNRLYITGLSYGGGGAYAFGLKFPGRYAAVVPVATGVMDEDELNPAWPGNWWHFCNEGNYRSKGVEIQRLEAFQSRVNALGGDFRIGTFPSGGHDAWSNAWREEAVWEWMFSKTADGAPVQGADGARVPTAVGTVSTAPRPVCTASVKGRDGGSGPERGADGLAATAYVSAHGLKAGDYWQAEFPEPVKGRFCLTLGRPDGSGAPTKARVNVSEDGEAWMTVLPLDRGKDFVVFTRSRPVRFVRILSAAPDNAREVLIVRNLTVE